MNHYTAINSFAKPVWLTFVIALTVMVSDCSGKRSKSQNLRIAVASNMQFVIGEIAEVFTEDTGIGCELIVSSSGKLTAQIKEGAPYDILISADLKYPQELFENKMTTSPPRVYARGRLVLFTVREDVLPGLDSLGSESIKHLAIANPQTAPYGRASAEVLMKLGMMEEIKEKMVYGESVAQVNQFISSGAADMGFTAMGVVLSSSLRDQGKWIEIDPSLHNPIEQAAVIIEREDGSVENATQFFNFLFSDKSKIILKKYRYSTNE